MLVFVISWGLLRIMMSFDDGMTVGVIWVLHRE